MLLIVLCVCEYNYIVVLGVLVVFIFFFFKQKTAYEMRISDWSSDVCSSDLGRQPRQHGGGLGTLQRDERTVGQLAQPDIALEVLLQVGDVGLLAARIHHQEQPVALVGDHEIVEDAAAVVGEERSEERSVGKACVITCRTRCLPYA